MKKSSWIILIVAALILLYGLSMYNRLVSGQEGVTNQWSQVETQYQRRFDLIPNLVESVKGVMKQEKEIFTALADARTKYGSAVTPEQRVSGANQVESALSRLLVIMENYPQLKSADTVQTLMSQLEGTENRVSVERKRYNDTVRDYNLLTKRFPSNLFAKMFSFDAKTYFEATQGSENAPKVEF
ncbi:MAG: LemA family protein [Patescibacteria group bacterium]|mgnify:CR=1 FL=1